MLFLSGMFLQTGIWRGLLPHKVFFTDFYIQQRDGNMKKTEKIFVIGHKNPDTDSICSAIAYADIKNRTTQGKRYIARRAGQINEETEYVLKKFGVHAPGYMPNVGTQVEDMDIHLLPLFDKTTSLKRAWDFMKENMVVTLPVGDADGHLEGIVTVSDITQVYMDTMDSCLLSSASTGFARIAETIQGRILSGDENSCFEKGRVLVGTANPELLGKFLHEDDMVIMGDRQEDQMEAVRQGVSCIIVGLNMPIADAVLSQAAEKGIVVISSPLDTFTISRLINQSIPVSHVMKSDDLITFSTEDFTDDIQEIMVKTRHQAFPVIDPNGKFIGTISRRNFLDMHRKKVILVDHNEKSQAADNIEKADILEIIDHHKLGSLETMAPISFRNKPVGCTGTIMYEIYGDQKLEISPKIAGLLCSAIISDTLMFRSPTCTLQDKMAAGALALIAGIDIAEHAKEMFRAGSNLLGKSPDQIFYQDYKKFIAEGDMTFGVGQISSMDPEDLQLIKEKLLPFLKVESEKHHVGKVFFMLTNILEESTELIYYGEGSEELAEAAFRHPPVDGSFILSGVVSRKKQLIPALMKGAQLLSAQSF